MQSSDWQTIVAKVAKPEGWAVFVTAWNAADLLNPVANAFLNSSCEKARSGWPCDPEMEKLREAYTRAATAAQQKEIATAVQRRLVEHTQYVPLGQWTAPLAARANIDGFLRSPVIALWNVKAN
jgi:peptide/nickel transport system substrate-binding protein